MISNLTRFITGFLFIIIITFSCNKETSGDGSLTEDEEIQASEISTESDAEAEIVFNGVFDDVMGVNDEVGLGGIGIFGRVANPNIAESERTTACFNVSLTPLNSAGRFPLKVVVDFGNGCLGRDGHMRYGKTITTYTDRLIVPGAKATTTFENFKIDSISVQGTHIITNTGTATTRQFKVSVEGGKLSKPNGNYSEWNSQKTITQTEGLLTLLLPLDDIFKIEGSANGKVKSSNILVAWKTEITEPLIKRFNCRWIIKGKIRSGRVTSNANSSWNAILDYGNGDCDKKATITINGTVFEISLH